MNLRDVWKRLTEERLDVGRSFIDNLGLALNHFDRANGIIPLEALDAAHVRAMMRMLMDAGRQPRTINNYRASIFYLMDQASQFRWPVANVVRRDVRKLKEPAPFPTAWRPEEFTSLVTSCRDARMCRGWGPDHWLALVLTVYDTSLRIGALLRSDVSQLDVKNYTLRVPGHLQKGRRETLQQLHRETCQRLIWLMRPSGDSRLFPWPFHRDELWRRFTTDVLIPAGLPHTSRDKFHKLRRTSYTLVAKEFGIAAASEHAAHKSDLSRYYLDPTLLDCPNPLDALPRPSVGFRGDTSRGPGLG